jgi:tetratricopeptide (TPR) repeat protein
LPEDTSPSPTARAPTGGRSTDRPVAAQIQQQDGLRIAFVRGHLRERAGQLAELLAPEARRDPTLLRFWHDLDRHVLRSQLPGASDATLDGAARLLDRLAVGPLFARLDDGMQGALTAFADHLGAVDLGIDVRRRSSVAARLARAHVIQDALAVLTGLPLGQKAPAGPLGCSSLVALPELTDSRELIVGRNFDLVPHGSSEPPLLVVHHPDKGLAHVSLHHGGSFTPGITAVNEAGLTVAVHQNFTREVSLRGRPILSVARELIETSRSLSAALEKLRGMRTAGGWTIVLADAARGRACAVEIDADGAASLFPPRDFLAVANCYRTRKKVHDFAFTGAWREHNWSRLSLLNRSARHGRGRFDLGRMAAALSDHTDAYDHDRQRAFGNTVSAIHNVDAAIFAPGLDAAYVAVGHTPRNSSDGFVGLSLSALFHERLQPLPSLPPAAEGPFRDALHRHSDACRLLYEGGDEEHAEALFEEAAELVPDEPIYRFMQGALQLKTGDTELAAETFAACVDDETSPYRRGLGRLMEGRALDVLGHRRQARAAYADVAPQAENVDPGLVRRARRDRAHPFSPRRASRLVIDTILADVPV